ncbi:MAG: hypothetical protein ACXV3S_11305 [Kineosporiaceae bacterium]
MTRQDDETQRVDAPHRDEVIPRPPVAEVAELPELREVPELRELPGPPSTGDEAVDSVVAALAAVVTRPVEDRLGVLEKVHRTLQDRLADVDE